MSFLFNYVCMSRRICLSVRACMCTWCVSPQDMYTSPQATFMSCAHLPVIQVTCWHLIVKSRRPFSWAVAWLRLHEWCWGIKRRISDLKTINILISDIFLFFFFLRERRGLFFMIILIFVWSILFNILVHYFCFDYGCNGEYYRISWLMIS